MTATGEVLAGAADAGMVGTVGVTVVAGRPGAALAACLWAAATAAAAAAFWAAAWADTAAASWPVTWLWSAASWPAPLLAWLSEVAWLA